MTTPISPPPPTPPRARGVYPNRTLNLRGIKAIGYDMDYTLIHYHVDVWERRAYEYARDRLVELGLPVGGLAFDADLVARGLIMDVQLGNVVKADQFGFVRAAAHGTSMLTFDVLRATYGRTFVDLRDDRWFFSSTLFDISAGCLYSQCVDLLDANAFDQHIGYRELFELVKRSLDAAHIEGRLKAEIIADPEAFVDLDPDTPRALLDQRDAGKRLLLITNSEWSYTRAMMRYAFDPFLPDGMSWRDLFEMVIVSARKPGFFRDPNPMYEVIDDEGRLLPLVGLPQPGGTYLGGNAALVEQALGVSDSDVLYVGDHIFADVNVTKRTVRWRTALILRELEADMEAIDAFESSEAQIRAMMDDKAALERAVSALRLDLLRRRKGRADILSGVDRAEVEAEIARLKAALHVLDAKIVPLAARSSRPKRLRWGPIMRAGIDKSHMARQIERFADIYTSRVGNFLLATPYVYLRPPKSSLPHDA